MGCCLCKDLQVSLSTSSILFKKKSQQQSTAANHFTERRFDSRFEYLHTVVFDHDDDYKNDEGNNISNSLMKSVFDKNSTDLIIKDDISINKSIVTNQENSSYLPFRKLVKETKCSNRTNMKKPRRVSINYDDKHKESTSKIITERDSKIESSNIPSLRNDVDISIAGSQVKNFPICAQSILKRILTSESKKSYSRVPNESKISFAKEEIISKEMSILKNSLYNTKPAKVFPSSRKSRSNLISRGTEIYQPKNRKGCLANYKYLFEDIELKKNNSIHQTSLRSSLHQKLNHKNDESEDCDLSNFSRHFNSNSVVKTLNTSYNVTRVDESTKGNSFYGKKNFKS